MEVVNPARISRGDVYLVALGPSIGSEIRKPRPCVVVSPDELNAHLQTLIVAPLTTGRHPYPFRVPCRMLDKRAHVVLDQIRTIDRQRLVRRLGQLPRSALGQCLQTLQAMFAV